jgi:hypothetical protein
MTRDEINAIAEAAAKAADISRGDAIQLATSMARTGTIGKEQIGGLMGVVKDFAATIGTDVKGAGKILTDIFSDPRAGIEKLEQQLGALDPTMRRYLQSLADGPDKVRLQNALLVELTNNIAKASDVTSGWARVWERISKTAGDAILAAGQGVDKLTGGGDTQDRIASEQKRADTIRRALPNYSGDAYKALEQQAKDIEAGIARLNSSAQRVREEGARAQGNAIKKTGEDLAKTEIPAMKTMDELLEKRQKLSAAVGQYKLGEAIPPELVKGLTAANAALEDYRGTQNGVTLDAKKRLAAQMAESQALSAQSVEEKRAAAEAQMRASLIGTEVVQLERKKLVEDAGRKATEQSADAIKRQSQAAEGAVKTNNAAADAYAKAGEGAASLAKFRRQAEEEVRTGQATDVTARTRELAREEASRLNAEAARAKDALKQQTEAQEGLNNQVAKGTISTQQASARLSAENEIRRLTAQAAVAEGDERQRLLGRINDLRGGYQALESAQSRATALGMIEGQRQQIEQIQKEITLVGKNADERERLLAVLRAEQELKRAGIPLGSDEARLYLANAESIAKYSVELQKAEKAHQTLMDAQREVGNLMASFVTDFLSGTGKLDDALKSLGKTFLNLSVKGLLTGEGPLAQLAGLGAQDGKSQGGLLGMAMGTPLNFSKEVQKGVTNGLKDFGDYVGPRTESETSGGGFLSSLGLSGATMGTAVKGIAAIAGLASAYGAGLSAKSPMMGAASGALSGAMSGAMLGSSFGPIGMLIGGLGGAVAGGGLGFLGGQSAQKQKEKQDRMDAIKQWEAMKEDVAAFRSNLRGEVTGGLTTAINDAFKNMSQAADVAYKAKQMDALAGLQKDYGTYIVRTITEFQAGFSGVLDSLTRGLGADSPFTKAKDNIKQLGDSLKGFISDTRRAYGTEPGGARSDGSEVIKATEAAKAYAIAVLATHDPLTLVASKLEDLRGTSAGLTQLLTDLGMSAEQAGAAIEKGVKGAMDRIRADFVADTQSKLNAALDKGYLNDAKSLMDEIAGMRADASTLGVGMNSVQAYFGASAQKIVDQAELVGDAFKEFITLFPQLAGVVHEFGKDAQANVDEARTALQAAYDAEAAALNTTISRLETFTQSIRKFRESLLLDNALSPLSPADKLAEARRQFESVSAAAMGGDQEAMDRLQETSQAYLDEAKAYYASSEDYFAAFNQVQGILRATEIKTQGQLDLARAQLVALNQQIEGLLTVNKSVLTVAEAVMKLRDAIEQLAASKDKASATKPGGTAADYGAPVITDTVSQAYQNILGRAPDPAGAAYWQSQINSGAVSYTDFISSLANSPEHRGYADGGVVSNGLFNVDSVLAKLAGGGSVALAGGEFVTRAPSVNPDTLGTLAAINQTGKAPSNDNSSAQEIRELRAEVRRLTSVVAEGAVATRSAVEQGNRIAAEMASDLGRAVAG